MTTLVLNDDLIDKIQRTAQSRGVSVASLLTDLLNLSEEAPQETPPLDLSAFDVLFDGVLAVDQQGRIVYWNTSASRIFGYTADDIIGQPLDLLIPEASRQRHAQLVADFSNAVFGRFMTNSVVSGHHQNGQQFYIDVTLSAIHQQEQAFTVAVFRDVTLREAQIQQNLERSQLLQMITESIGELICVFDDQGLLTYVSPMVERLYGLTPEQILGTDGYDNIHPDDREAVKSFFAGHRTNHEPHHFRFRMLMPNDQIFWVERTLKHVFDEMGQIKHSVSITRNITEQYEAEQALKSERDLFASIMAASPAGLNAVDAQGNIIFANRRAEEILGAPATEITGRTYNAPEWKHTDYEGNPWPDEKQPFVRVMQTKQPVWDVRHAIQWSSGETVYLSINGMPILDENGEIDKIIFAIEDYTAQKIRQDKLEAALERAQFLSEIRAQFISMVNHEFRTPLQIINSSVDILQMKRAHMSEKEFLSRTGRIQQQVHILDEMLRDVSFINKYDRIGYNIRPESLSLAEFFTNLAEELSTVYPQHMPVAIIHKGEDKIISDILLMHHIFSNLIGNALKYSDVNKHVKCLVDNRGKLLHVEIRDQGRGIPEKDQAQIFEEFRRGRNVGELQGSGLGLAIALRSVKRLNGGITFTSTEGEGTTFYVTIPLIKALGSDNNTSETNGVALPG